MLDKTLTESDLDALYGWVDTLELSRPKKHINRDFSDAVLMAETISNFYPKLVNLHNYPAANSVKAKMTNWKTLSTKTLSKLGLTLKNEDCQKLASASPMSIEVLLFEFMKMCAEEEVIHQQNERASKGLATNERERVREKSDNIPRRQAQSNPNRAQELKEVLKLIKQKINNMEKLIQRKDSEIQELQEIIHLAS